MKVELRRRRCKGACLAAMLAGTAIVGTVVLRGPSSAPTGPDAPKPPPVAGPAAGGPPPTAARAAPAAGAARTAAPADTAATDGEAAPGGAAGNAAATSPPVARVGGAAFTVGASLRADATVHPAGPEAPRGADAHAVETSPPTPPPPLPAGRRIDLEVSAGDTLIGMLLRLGIGRAEAHAAVEGLRDVYDPRRLRPGQHLEVQTDAAARRLVRLAFAPSERERIELVRADGGFEAERRARPTVTEERLVEAEVRTSLHAAATTAGVPAVVLAEVLRIFSWDVDYQREMRPGDEITVLFDRERIPGGPVVGAGDVRYARLAVGDRVLEAFRFERDGEALFFDRDGKSRRKFLLRTPVSGARLSSGFGMRRHPILGYTRMHQGVDFAAPTGTPILAAGDGRLVRVGRYGSYGNYVRIAHGEVYATAYAHLAGFADGVRAGHRVEQGEVIGYVGSTGRSTGPHLHFEVLEHGEPVDPLGIAQSPAQHLAGDALAAFHREIRAVETRLAALGNRTFAAERAPGGASGG